MFYGNHFPEIGLTRGSICRACFSGVCNPSWSDSFATCGDFTSHLSTPAPSLLCWWTWASSCKTTTLTASSGSMSCPLDHVYQELEFICFDLPPKLEVFRPTAVSLTFLFMLRDKLKMLIQPMVAQRKVQLHTGSGPIFFIWCQCFNFLCCTHKHQSSPISPSHTPT